MVLVTIFPRSNAKVFPNASVAIHLSTTKLHVMAAIHGTHIGTVAADPLHAHVSGVTSLERSQVVDLC